MRSFVSPLLLHRGVALPDERPEGFRSARNQSSAQRRNVQPAWLGEAGDDSMILSL
jgi:hypothetical protein